MKDAPCKNCSNRHPICHDTCSAYQEWKKYRDALAAHLSECRGNDADILRMENIHKTLKEKHR